MLDLSQWEKWAERPSTVNRNELCAPQLWKDGKIDFLVIPKGENAEYWMPREPKKRYYKKIARELLNVDFNEHIAKYERLAKEAIEKSVFDINQSNIKLAQKYREFFEVQAKFSFFYHSLWALEEFLDLTLRKKLEQKFGEKKGMELYTKLTLPMELIAFQEMQKELQKLANNYSEKDLRELEKEWAWLGEYSLQEKLYDKKHFKTQLELAKYSTENIEEKIMENRQHFQTALSQLDTETAKLAILINKYITLRTNRVDVVKKALANMRPFYKELAKRIKNGFTYNDAINLTIEETLNFLEHNIIPALNEVRKRTAGQVAYYCHNGEATFIPLSSIKQQTQESRITETTGVIANRGRYSGPAAIVVKKSDLSKIRDGCVLVAKTTYPEYTPFMKKAVAIVTDEGGITSHAAIVSRELNIPCIVGTKNATKIFTDNEIILVDANEGKVEKVSK